MQVIRKKYSSSYVRSGTDKTSYLRAKKSAGLYYAGQPGLELYVTNAYVQRRASMMKRCNYKPIAICMYVFFRLIALTEQSSTALRTKIQVRI